jgi:transposase InsO family protein
LKYLLDQRLSTIPQHHWVSKLLGFDFRVEYRPGRNNIVADALSRRDMDDAAIFSLSGPAFQVFDQLRQAAASQPALVALRDKILVGTRKTPWAFVDGLVLFKGRAYLPPKSSILQDILVSTHDVGHEGAEKTLHRFRRDFHTPRARAIIQDLVRHCITCQRNKTEHLHPAGLLAPLPVPTSVWSDISMDIIEGLPKVGGKSVILLVVDRFSKYVHFIALRHPYSAETVASVFFSEVVRLHGLPSTIVSDRDPVFTSTFWTTFFKLMGTKLHMSSAFHPQSDGQTEAVNKTIGMYLRCLTGDRPRQWLRWLPWAEYVYNTSFHTALKETPFRIIYGRDPPALREYDLEECRVPAVTQSMTEREEFLSDVRARLEQAEVVAKRAYDRGHRAVSFSPGDWVWL